MFKVAEIKIKGFWGEYQVGTGFHEDVNIFIGENGTGKTTFMNILHAVLSVDPEGLLDNEFSEVRILLIDGAKRRTVRAMKSEEGVDAPFPMISYFISNQKFMLPLPGDERSYLAYRRRALEQASQIREVLSNSILLSSLTVYRFRVDPDTDPRERSKRVQSPVDAHLQSLQNLLTQYQYELTSQAQKLSVELQKSVLISLLYSPEYDSQDLLRPQNDETERRNLLLAYKQLGLSGPDISSRIQKHVAAISQTLSSVKRNEPVPVAALDARMRLSRIVEMSLESETKTTEVFAPLQRFLTILSGFIKNKEFRFEHGELQVSRTNKDASARHRKPPNPSPISLWRLSSGEKQLLILFIEALLQRERAFVYLADEPELSLHISWQQKIISAIRELNPNSQIIVATHSPEIAGRFSKNIIDMEDILHA